MESVGEGHHEDQQRAFFRLHVGELGKVLPICWTYAKSRMDEGPAVKLEALTEVNDIVLVCIFIYSVSPPPFHCSVSDHFELNSGMNATQTVLMSALEWRDWNRRVYGVELPYIKPWTSDVEIIQVAMELFDTAAAFLESREQGEGETLQEQRVGVLRAQLAELAAVVFHCFNERLAWVQRCVFGFYFISCTAVRILTFVYNSAAAAGEPGTDRDKALVEERFTHLRPDVLDTLRTSPLLSSIPSLPQCTAKSSNPSHISYRTERVHERGVPARGAVSRLSESGGAMHEGSSLPARDEPEWGYDRDVCREIPGRVHG